jgi:sigma-B regulation protein RsbU (phosphoserine phosphatase)
MGIDKDLKIAQVFARLNRVIHRSNLSSRFVSVFYGELEASGNIVYVNAGHPAPFVASSDGHVQELSTGGTVIGPLPEARFRHGHAKLKPGDVLVMCTDGILERRSPDGEFFAEERLRAAVQQVRTASAADIVEHVFRVSTEWSRRRSWEDDATLLVVRRLAASAA